MFFLKSPYQAATRAPFSAEPGKGKIGPNRFLALFQTCMLPKSPQVKLASFTWDHQPFNLQGKPVKMQVKCSSSSENNAKYMALGSFCPAPPLTCPHKLCIYSIYNWRCLCLRPDLSKNVRLRWSTSLSKECENENAFHRVSYIPVEGGST